MPRTARVSNKILCPLWTFLLKIFFRYVIKHSIALCQKGAYGILFKARKEEKGIYLQTIDILASQMRFQFSIYDMMAQLIYSRIIYPCSKSKTVSSVFPHLYNNVSISEDQIFDGCAFIGPSVKKYIMGFSLLSGTEFFVVPKNGVLRNN